MAHWSAWTIVAPLLGAAFLGLAGRALSSGAVRWLTLAIGLVTLALAGKVAFDFPPTAGATLSIVDWTWIAGGETGVNVRFDLGLDGLSLWLFALSALLTLTAILVSWTAVTERVSAYYSLLLLLEAGMLGVFAARDVIVFYVFFEFTLIPLFFLIGGWGSEERRRAAIKFFLFTFVGSVFAFLGLLTIVLWDYRNSGLGALRFSIPELTAALASRPIDATLQTWIFLALFAGFAIKVPLFPLHTWLPLAHVQAPTAGSVLLAGVLLKIGVYGFIRFGLAMLPEGAVTCMPWILWLSVVGIVYGALVALAQSDIKKLIAYSSVSHLGFCMLGLFAMDKLGLQGGALQMINHGLSTGGLFAIVGMLYERYHTRKISDLAGLARRLPVLATFMVLFTMSSIGLPGLNGFVGEFMILLGMFQRGWGTASTACQTQWTVIAVIAVSGVVLGAWYMLWLVERVFFGGLREPKSTTDGHAHGPVHDLTLREIAALAPLAVFVFWIGLAPQRFLAPMQSVLDPLVDGDSSTIARAIAEKYGQPTPVGAPIDLGPSFAEEGRRRMPTSVGGPGGGGPGGGGAAGPFLLGDPPPQPTSPGVLSESPKEGGAP